MILVESSLNALAENWSGQMSTDANFQLQISYYNEAFSVWEPVIEPIQNKENDSWENWQLTCAMRSYSELEDMSNNFEGNNNSKMPMPKMTVNIEAKEMMNVTITKSFISLLHELSGVCLRNFFAEYILKISFNKK